MTTEQAGRLFQKFVAAGGALVKAFYELPREVACLLRASVMRGAPPGKERP
jgi:hypothetical protein